MSIGSFSESDPHMLFQIGPFPDLGERIADAPACERITGMSERGCGVSHA
jgi:hypothetical protein